MSTKVLLLAMDAGDKHLIESFAADGTMTNLRSLFSRGLVGDTISLEGFFEGSTWPSLYTGVTPARHGFHRLVQLTPGSYEFQKCNIGRLIKNDPFWVPLSSSGRKVAILDIPLSYVTGNINGIQMVEWGSHDPVYGFRAWPGDVKRDVLARFGNHPFQESCDSFPRTPRGFSDFRDRLIQGVEKKTELTKYYLHSNSWDFMAQVFTEGHCAGHQCWHLHDTNHPSHDPETAAITGDPIRDVYMAIDAAIGEILAEVDNNTVVVFLASHRMAHNYGAQILLPEVLIRLHAAEALRPGGWRNHVPERAKEVFRPIRDYMRRRSAAGRGFFPYSCSGIDMQKSKCFPQENGYLVGGIRMNLMGREPGGRIMPGAELDSFCEELGRDLLDIIDLDTGVPVIKSVKRTDTLYRGDHLMNLPDLLVDWDDKKPVGSAGTKNPKGSKIRIASEKIGVVEGINTYCRTGDHRPEGLFIAMGRGIRSGHMNRPVSLMDLAPTFTQLFGVPLPNVDGRAIPEILEGDLLF
jgi:predicted AlkP superfamily phosphohydrolase/phosphomutase